METAKDETDVYLFWHSCKEGCPKGYDKDAPCYPFTDDSEANTSEEGREEWHQKNLQEEWEKL